MSLVATNSRKIEKKDRSIKFVIHNGQFRLIAFVHTVWQHVVICEQKLCQWLSIDSPLISFDIFDFI